MNITQLGPEQIHELESMPKPRHVGETRIIAFQQIASVQIGFEICDLAFRAKYFDTPDDGPHLRWTAVVEIAIKPQ